MAKEATTKWEQWCFYEFNFDDIDGKSEYECDLENVQEYGDCTHAS